jgi:arsenate reductase
MNDHIKPIKVLFLCVANSARSQMAEGLLRSLGQGLFEAFSAGTNPTTVHPLAIRVMSEIGIDISQQKSKSVSQYMGTKHFGYIITLCGPDQDLCPSSFPDISVRLSWNLPDPALPAAEEEQLARFRSVRDQLIQLITGLINDAGR